MHPHTLATSKPTSDGPLAFARTNGTGSTTNLTATFGHFDHVQACAYPWNAVVEKFLLARRANFNAALDLVLGPALLHAALAISGFSPLLPALFASTTLVTT